MIIDGRKITVEIIAELKKLPKPKEFLAAVLVGEDPVSVSFLKQKENVARELGTDFRFHRFPVDVTQKELREKVSELASDPACGGIILQLPLPPHIDRQVVVSAIPPEKDVDALHSNLVFPPAVGVVEKIIRNLKLEIKDSRVAVIGLGFLVGKPISKWLNGKCNEIYLLDIGSDFEILKNADLVISGVGKAGLVKPEMLKDNALVIDFGYSYGNGKVRGDFDSHGAEDINYTPTPGGTGPILVAKLFENFYKLQK